MIVPIELKEEPQSHRKEVDNHSIEIRNLLNPESISHQTKEKENRVREIKNGVVMVLKKPKKDLTTKIG